MQGLTMILHSFSGVGKSLLADTAPGPRLILDAEGGSRFTPSQPKIHWDPVWHPPPACPLLPEQFETYCPRIVTDENSTDVTNPAFTALEAAGGKWESCIVFVREFATVSRVFQWLDSGQHAFVSVILDSLTEIQKRCKDAIVGTGHMAEQAWGQLLVQMEDLVRKFRDLVTHPVRPVKAVVILAITAEKNGRLVPAIQGALGSSLPGFVDIIGYMQVTTKEDGTPARQLLLQPWGNIEAKDRTDRFPMSVYVDKDRRDFIGLMWKKVNFNGGAA